MRDASDHLSATPDTQAPVGRLAAGVIGTIVVCAGLSLAVAGTTAPEMTPAVIAGGVSALIGAMLGLLPLVMAGRVKPVALAMAWIFGSTTRMLVAAGAALAATLAGEFDPMWTMGVMLIASLAALAVEMLIIMPVVGTKPNTEGAL